MAITQKCQYAIRAVYELARRYGEGPVRISDIARSQAIPARFLEVILSQLKQGGFVASQRGSAGGYTLARPPQKITVGEIIRFTQGPLDPVVCLFESSKERCPLYGTCAFLPMWQRAHNALSEVYDTTTFQGLLSAGDGSAAQPMACYNI